MQKTLIHRQPGVERNVILFWVRQHNNYTLHEPKWDACTYHYIHFIIARCSLIAVNPASLFSVKKPVYLYWSTMTT